MKVVGLQIELDSFKIKEFSNQLINNTNLLTITKNTNYQVNNTNLLSS
jgi:hypothetical protein